MAKQDSDPRPSRANADKDPRPSRADANADPRPTGKPQANTSKRSDSPSERVENSPTSDPGQREQTADTQTGAVVHTPGS